MYLTSTLSSTDITDYNWPEGELARFQAYMTSPEPLWRSLPPDKTDKGGRRAFWAAEIRHWLATRRVHSDAYMSAQEIGAAGDRPFLLPRALLDNVAYCYREKIGADERGANYLLGVLVAHTIFSDNDRGYSTVTAPRIAKLLGCSEKSVLRANELLVANQVMCRQKRPGLEDRYWPVINRALAGEGTSTVWWLDATSEAIRRGRPVGKPQTAEVQSFPGSGKPQTGEKPQTTWVRPLEQTPDPNPENPGPLGSDDITKDITKDKRGAPPVNGNAQEAMAEALNPDSEIAFAKRNVWVNNFGELEIGDELRERLCKVATNEQIDLALPRALERAQGIRQPHRLLEKINYALSYARQDAAKAAKSRPSSTKGVF